MSSEAQSAVAEHVAVERRGVSGIARLITAGAGGAFAIRIGAAGLAYGLQIVLARALGAGDYGLFSFAWNLITIGGFLASFGYAQIAVRFLANAHQAEDGALQRGFLRQAFIITLIGSGLAAGAIWLGMPLIEQGYGALCCLALGLGLAALPAFAMTDLIEGVARSRGWTIRALAPPYLVRQGSLIVLLLGAMALGKTVSLELAMLMALGATWFGLALAVFMVLPGVLAPLRGLPSKTDTPSWNRAARPTFLSDLALLARQHADLIILGLFAPPAVIGVYFAATRVASLLGLIEFAVSATYGHRFARKLENAATLYAEARNLTRIAGFAAGIALMLVSPLIFSLFGSDFAAASSIAFILLAAGIFRLIIGPAEDALAMTGNPEATFRANTLGASMMVLLCLLLCPTYQAIGAAIASAGGTVISGLSLYFALRRAGLTA